MMHVCRCCSSCPSAETPMCPDRLHAAAMKTWRSWQHLHCLSWVLGLNILSKFQPIKHDAAVKIPWLVFTLIPRPKVRIRWTISCDSSRKSRAVFPLEFCWDASAPAFSSKRTILRVARLSISSKSKGGGAHNQLVIVEWCGMCPQTWWLFQWNLAPGRFTLAILVDTQRKSWNMSMVGRSWGLLLRRNFTSVGSWDKVYVIGVPSTKFHCYATCHS